MSAIYLLLGLYAIYRNELLLRQGSKLNQVLNSQALGFLVPRVSIHRVLNVVSLLSISVYMLLEREADTRSYLHFTFRCLLDFTFLLYLRSEINWREKLFVSRNFGAARNQLELSIAMLLYIVICVSSPYRIFLLLLLLWKAAVLYQIQRSRGVKEL